jgi:hypothetical protein
MNEKASHGRTLTRRDRCTRIITEIFRDGQDHEIRDALQSVLVCRGLSALTDAAIEDLATRAVAGKRALRFTAKRESGSVIFLDQHRSQRKNWVTRTP